MYIWPCNFSISPPFLSPFFSFSFFLKSPVKNVKKEVWSCDSAMFSKGLQAGALGVGLAGEVHCTVTEGQHGENTKAKL